MQITINHLIELLPNVKAATALRVGVQHSQDGDVVGAVKAAYAWLEQEDSAVFPIGHENLFGEVQSPESWEAEKNEHNEALVAVKRVAHVLGVDLGTTHGIEVS